MPQKLSRRELLAWMAAGGGAAATGGLLLSQQDGDSAAFTARNPTGSTSSSTTSTTAAAPVVGRVSATSPPPDGDRLLVVVEMPGGNDGHSMVVPDGVTGFYDLRPQTGIASADVLRIDDLVGFAPSLPGLHQRGATIVHGVGSTTPDGSHFEMMNRWWAGNPRLADTPTGWVGRLADVLDDGTSPVTAMSVAAGGHPIIRSAKGTTIALPGVDSLWTVSGADPGDRFMRTYQRSLRTMTAATGTAGPAHLARTTMAETIEFADRLLDGAARDSGEEEGEEREAAGDDADGGYGWEQLGQALRFAASTFERDLGVRVIHVSMSGDFDTHEGHAYTHPELMGELDRALASFHDDLVAKGLDDRVAVMTVSEFGRTAGENGSAGLDHGTSSTMLLEGPGLRDNRELGEIPSLTRFDDNGDFLTTVPFDSYLAGVVEHWLGVPASEVFPSAPQPLDIFA